jgi:undecaprenyl-diphosphatase
MTVARAEGDQREWPWLATALASLVGLGFLTMAVAQNLLIPFDQPLLTFALSLRALQPLWDLISFIGNYPMIPIAIAFVLWLIYVKRRREAVLVIVLLALATAGSELLKALVARPRPLGSAPGIPGVIYSYPSGHAFEDLIIFGMMSLRLWRSSKPFWLRALAVILTVAEVALISVARVALDLHYPSDVLAGLLSGLAVLGLYAWWTRPGAWADHPPRRAA